MDRTQTTHAVRALLFKEEEWWVAQCLEYDLATQARRVKDLVRELERLLIAQVVVAHHTGRVPFANLPSAPDRFEALWAEAMILSPGDIECVSDETGEIERPDVEYRLADVA